MLCARFSFPMGSYTLIFTRGRRFLLLRFDFIYHKKNKPPPAFPFPPLPRPHPFRLFHIVCTMMCFVLEAFLSFCCCCRRACLFLSNLLNSLTVFSEEVQELSIYSLFLPLCSFCPHCPLIFLIIFPIGLVFVILVSLILFYISLFH